MDERCRHDGSTEVTEAAIAIAIAAIEQFGLSALCDLRGGGSVLVLVVPEVTNRSAARFVTAIGRSCRPGELERQDYEHQHDEKAAHGAAV